MKKIVIVGCTGSGKSTLAGAISEKTGIPRIELDALYWGPDWYEPPDSEFFPKIEEAIKSESWIIAGNYTRTRSITWAEADTLIWIDFSYLRTLYQSLKRAISRIISQEELWEGTGNRERVRQLFSRQSIILWFLKSYHGVRKKYLSDMNDPDFNHLNFIHLKSRSQVRNFLNSI